MATICRLCATLKKIDNFVRLNDPSLNLSAKIEKCCQLYIDTNDSLPQNVCTECVQSLDDCWKFVTKVIEAQESLAKIFHSDETLSGEPSKKLVEKLKINVTSTKIDIDKEEQASESRDDLSLKLENFDDVYEIAEVHLENEHEYITEEEISEEHTELGVDVETMEIISEEQVKEETVDSWHNYPWICCSCSVILSSQVELKIHYSSEHKDDGILKYTCADCSKVIDKYYAFINHVKSRHREHLLLSCDVCAQTFKNVVELADHRLSAHPEDKESSEELVLCPICGKAFRNQTALQIHANCHQPDDVKYKFACNVCEKKFGSKPNLKAHQKIHSGIKIIKSRKRNAIWKIFTDVGLRRAKCSICSAVLSMKGGSLFNLSRHMRSKHPGMYRPPNKILFSKLRERAGKKIRSSVFQNIHKRLPLPTEIDDNSTASSLLDVKPQQSELDKLFKLTSESVKPPSWPQVVKLIDEQLLRMMVKEYHPFNIVEDNEFKELIHLLNPNYQLPSKITVSTTLMPELYEKTRSIVKNHLDYANFVTVTVDQWTSTNNHNFLAVTVHFIDDDCVLRSFLLDCFDHSNFLTVDRLAMELKRVLKGWNLADKVVAVVADDSDSIKRAIKMNNWRHIPCFAHEINTIVLTGIQEIAETQKKVKTIAEFFNNNDQATLELFKTECEMDYPERKLKKEKATTWNSTYEMFDRFRELKEPVSGVGIGKWLLPKLTPKDWDIIGNACELLRAFDEVTTEISTEKCTSASKIILLSNALKAYVIKFSQNLPSNAPFELKKMVAAILRELKVRFGEIEHHELLAESSLLDPRFKRQSFSEESAFRKAYSSLSQEAIRLQPEESHVIEVKQEKDIQSTSLLWQDFDLKIVSAATNEDAQSTIIIELEKFLKEFFIHRRSDPMLWWKEKKTKYPRLFESVKKRLCMVATCVSSERIFSKSGVKLAERRSRITSKKLAKIMFLNYNF